MVDEAELGNLLDRWRVVAPVVARAQYDPEFWPGFVFERRRPAPADDIRLLEARLGRVLPPSYRCFLQITNGTHELQFGEQQGFHSTDIVDWVVNAEPGLPHLNSTASDSGAADFTDEPLKFFLWRESGGAYTPGYGHEFSCLSIGPLCQPHAIWLNPLVQDSHGEWECWVFDTHDSSSAFRSFGEYFRNRVETLERQAAAVPVVEDLYAKGSPNRDDLRAVVRRRWCNPVGHLEDTIHGESVPEEMLAEIRSFIEEERSWASVQWLRVIPLRPALELGEVAWEGTTSPGEKAIVFQAIAHQSSAESINWLAAKFVDLEGPDRDSCGHKLTFEVALAVFRLRDSQDIRERLLGTLQRSLGRDFNGDPQVQQLARGFLADPRNSAQSRTDLFKSLGGSVDPAVVGPLMTRASVLQAAGTGALRAIRGASDEAKILSGLLQRPDIPDGQRSTIAWQLLSLDASTNFDALCKDVEIPLGAPYPYGPIDAELQRRVIDKKLDQAQEHPIELETLAFVRDPRATALIMEAFDNRSADHTRQPALTEICRALEIQRTPDAIAALQRLATHGLAPIASLARLGDAEAIDNLTRQLTSSDQIPWLVARLYESGSPKTIEPLVAAAQITKDAGTRTLVAAATARHDTTHLYLDDWANDGEPQRSLLTTWRQNL